MKIDSATARSDSWFYGWWLVLVCLIVQAIGFGTTLYLYSVVAGALEREFPSGRLLLMMGASGLFLASALMSPRIGKLLDRHPLKRILMGGALLMGLGFILMAFSTRIWHVIICYTFFIAAGMATLSPLTCSTLLSRWFVRNRGLALGIAALGTQLGGLLFAPLIATLIEWYDWRLTVGGMGLCIMVFAPLLFYFTVVDHPWQKGLQADGAASAGDAPSNETVDSNNALATPSIRQLFSEPNFLILAYVISAASVVNVGLLANLSLFATDIGETTSRAALLISLLAMLGMISSPLMGRLCDIFSMRSLTLALLACMTLAPLLFMSATNYPMLLAATLFQGIAGGAIVPLWAALVGRLYDIRIYGSVMGAATLAVFGAIALGPTFTGWIYDMTGSYRLVFLTMVIVMLVALLLATLLRIPDHSAEKIHLKTS